MSSKESKADMLSGRLPCGGKAKPAPGLTGKSAGTEMDLYGYIPVGKKPGKNPATFGMRQGTTTGRGYCHAGGDRGSGG